jgi:hypothetical protein
MQSVSKEDNHHKKIGSTAFVSLWDSICLSYLLISINLSSCLQLQSDYRYSERPTCCAPRFEPWRQHSFLVSVAGYKNPGKRPPGNLIFSENLHTVLWEEAFSNFHATLYIIWSCTMPYSNLCTGLHCTDYMPQFVCIRILCNSVSPLEATW